MHKFSGGTIPNYKTHKNIQLKLLYRTIYSHQPPNAPGWNITDSVTFTRESRSIKQVKEQRVLIGTGIGIELLKEDRLEICLHYILKMTWSIEI